MKKIISGLMLLFAALTLTSCIEMTSETKLSFEKLPEAVIIVEDADGNLYDKEILIKIEEGEHKAKILTLKAAEQVGAVVEGAEYKSAGYHTLLVTYKDVTIAFTYLVVEQNSEIPSAVDTSWYYGHEGDQEFTLTSAAQLRGLAKLVNEGTADFENQTVKLGANIDLAGYPWTPIGEGSRRENGKETTRTDRTFKGTFDGVIYTISNLSDAGYVPGKSSSYTNTSDVEVNGYVYGLFGMINASNVKIKNVKLENVKINGVTTVDGKVYFADAVAGIVGYSGHDYTETNTETISSDDKKYADIEFINCSVTGNIKGYDSTAALVGRTFFGRFVFENCKISVDLYASRGTASGKMGGLIAAWTEATSKNNDTDPLVFVHIDDCEVSVNPLNETTLQGRLIGYVGNELGEIKVKIDGDYHQTEEGNILEAGNQRPIN